MKETFGTLRARKQLNRVIENLQVALRTDAYGLDDDGMVTEFIAHLRSVADTLEGLLSGEAITDEAMEKFFTEEESR